MKTYYSAVKNIIEWNGFSGQYNVCKYSSCLLFWCDRFQIISDIKLSPISLQFAAAAGSRQGPRRI